MQRSHILPEAPVLDRAAGLTPGLDGFCSGGAWGLSAAETFHPEAEPVHFTDGTRHVMWLAHPPEDDGRVWTPAEAMWGLGSPVLGDTSEDDLAAGLMDTLSPGAPGERVVLCGVLSGSALETAILTRLRAARVRGFRSSETTRDVADLSAGPEAYLARRSRHFRRSLRVSERRCTEAGVRFEAVPLDPAGFSRVLAVEARSWKGQADTGLGEPELRGFYRRMVPRLHATGAGRLLMASVDDEDIGYLMGGVAGNTYRALQFSYVAEHRALGLGNALQWQLMTGLPAAVSRYDLGTTMAYKARWADTQVVSGSWVLEGWRV